MYIGNGPLLLSPEGDMGKRARKQIVGATAIHFKARDIARGDFEKLKRKKY